ncbi:hypothetical protein MJH54_34280 [Salmonella enterica subsp. enterica serovar Montevideo]|nr:hypothetical protein [Salmonella enterica subsp. enterica serovar Montevideo]
MALLQISEPGLSAAPHQRRLAAGIDLGTTNSLVATVRSGCGFTFGDGCHGSDTKFNLFNSSRIDAINITEVRDKAEGE